MAYPLAGLKGASMLLAGNPPFKNYTHIVLVKCVPKKSFLFSKPGPMIIFLIF